MVAQGPTTKQTENTVEKQFQWMKTYEKSLALLCDKNNGNRWLTKKSFNKVIHNFVYGSDETYIKSCDNGSTQVTVSAGHKKHTKKDKDSRISITMYPTGSSYGVTGPTIFLIEVKNKRDNYTGKILWDNGAAPG